MIGIVEDLRDQVSELQTALVKLCAKSGHQDENGWTRCNVYSHHHDPRTRAPKPEYDVDKAHQTKCSICGEYACLREDS